MARNKEYARLLGFFRDQDRDPAHLVGDRQGALLEVRIVSLGPGTEDSSVTSESDMLTRWPCSCKAAIASSRMRKRYAGQATEVDHVGPVGPDSARPIDDPFNAQPGLSTHPAKMRMS